VGDELLARRPNGGQRAGIECDRLAPDHDPAVLVEVELVVAREDDHR
jgi:hypothetical protein